MTSLDRISQALSFSTTRLDQQASVANTVSLGDVANTLLELGEELDQVSLGGVNAVTPPDQNLAPSNDFCRLAQNGDISVLV